MKNTIFSIAIFLVLTAIFAGCGQNPQPVSGVSTSSNNQKSDSASVSENLLPYMVTTSTGIYNQQTAGTEEGCYTIFQNSTGDYNLFYIDYATKRLVYLSSSPASAHNTEDDTSFLGRCPGGASLFTEGEHLYLVILGGTFGGERISVPAQIIQMDLDGSNKKNLYSFDEGGFLGNTAFACDGKTLYFWINEIAAEKNLLVGVSTETGKAKTLAEFSGDTHCQILGTTEEKLILEVLTPKNEKEYALISLSVRSGEQKELIRWSYGERSFVIHQGKGYSFSQAEGTLYHFSLFTGEETIFSENFLPMENGEQYRLITDAYDEHLFFLEQNTNDLFVVECETGTAKKITLQKYGFNASIVAETEDNFLVFQDYKTFKFMGTSSDGTPEEQQLMIQRYALIDKEDYWNSAPKYTYISYDDFVA